MWKTIGDMGVYYASGMCDDIHSNEYYADVISAIQAKVQWKVGDRLALFELESIMRNKYEDASN